MKDTYAKPPSLADSFEPEREILLHVYTQNNLSNAQMVAEARRALDRTGQNFQKNISDPLLTKAALWLLEIVKTGAGILDQSVGADIVWHEIPKPKNSNFIGQGLFFGAALGLGIYALLNGSRLTLIAVFILACLRLFDRHNRRALLSYLPFFRKRPALEDNSGRAIKAEAQININASAYISNLADALKTADHILLRLSQPETDTHWREDLRLMGLIQGLLEARQADDGDFALKLIGQELDTILAAEGIHKIEYSTQTAHLFDVLPGIGQDQPKLAAPALMADDKIIRRGTIWGSDNE